MARPENIFKPSIFNNLTGKHALTPSYKKQWLTRCLETAFRAGRTRIHKMQVYRFLARKTYPRKDAALSGSGLMIKTFTSRAICIVAALNPYGRDACAIA